MSRITRQSDGIPCAVSDTCINSDTAMNKKSVRKAIAMEVHTLLKRNFMRYEVEVKGAARPFPSGSSGDDTARAHEQGIHISDDRDQQV